MVALTEQFVRLSLSCELCPNIFFHLAHVHVCVFSFSIFGLFKAGGQGGQAEGNPITRVLIIPHYTQARLSPPLLAIFSPLSRPPRLDKTFTCLHAAKWEVPLQQLGALAAAQDKEQRGIRRERHQQSTYNKKTSE